MFFQKKLIKRRHLTTSLNFPQLVLENSLRFSVGDGGANIPSHLFFLTWEKTLLRLFAGTDRGEGLFAPFVPIFELLSV